MKQLNSDQFAVGIDVGGSSLKCGLVAANGEIIAHKLVSLADVKTENEVINKIVQVIDDFSMRIGAIAGVGIGFPGLVNNNIIIEADNLPGFSNTPLGQILYDATGIANIIIDNDANLMGLGELYYGAARDCNDVIFLTIGTGVGGAMLLNGQLYGGFRNRGAELGHMIVVHGGADCGCGGKGCLEAYASVTALVNYYRSISNAKSRVDGHYIVSRYLEGEYAAVQAMDYHLEHLASGIASLANIFGPQKILIGGGISEAGYFYIRELMDRTVLRAIPVVGKYLKIEAAQLGNNAGLLGAVAKVFSTFCKEEDRL